MIDETDGNDSFFETFKSELWIDRELSGVFVEMGNDRLSIRRVSGVRDKEIDLDEPCCRPYSWRYLLDTLPARSG